MIYVSPGRYDCHTHVGFYRKNEAESIDVEICFDDVLAADEFIDFTQWSSTVGLTFVTTEVDGKLVSASVIGGESGKIYAVACTIDSSKYQRIRRAAFISVVGWPT